MRHAMVASQLRTNAVSDPRVVAAMAAVPREAFLPSDVRAIAYRDTAVPLGRGRAQNVPIATGRLLTEAYLLPRDRVLLIGAASGYTAAVLAGLVSSVVAVESDPFLAAMAREGLAECVNVTLVEGPLEAGHPGSGPYDVLIIDGAIEQVPDSLVAQLAVGGRRWRGLPIAASRDWPPVAGPRVDSPCSISPISTAFPCPGSPGPNPSPSERPRNLCDVPNCLLASQRC